MTTILPNSICLENSLEYNDYIEVWNSTLKFFQNKMKLVICYGNKSVEHHLMTGFRAKKVQQQQQHQKTVTRLYKSERFYSRTIEIKHTNIINLKHCSVFYFYNIIML
jgi:hypothetical protein